MIPKRLSRKIIYENAWVNLYVDKVEYGNKKILDAHHFIHFDYLSASIVIQNEKNEILLVKANRYITQSEEWEIPAGQVEANETSVSAIIRETLEETGYEIDRPELIYRYHPMNGISDKECLVYKAKAIKKIQDFDEIEISEYQWFSIENIKQMIKDNVIHCGVSLIGLLLVLQD